MMKRSIFALMFSLISMQAALAADVSCTKAGARWNCTIKCEPYRIIINGQLPAGCSFLYSSPHGSVCAIDDNTKTFVFSCTNQIATSYECPVVRDCG